MSDKLIPLRRLRLTKLSLVSNSSSYIGTCILLYYNSLIRFVSLKYRTSYVYTMIGKQEPGNPFNRVSKSKGKSERFEHHDGIAISNRVCKAAADVFSRRVFFVRCFSLSS